MLRKIKSFFHMLLMLFIGMLTGVFALMVSLESNPWWLTAFCGISFTLCLLVFWHLFEVKR